MFKHLKYNLLILVGFISSAIYASDSIAVSDQLYVEARQCYLDGQFDCVRDRCEQIIKFIPNSKLETRAKAYNLLGVISRKEGNLLEAVSYYEEALTITEDSAFMYGLLLNISIVHNFLGDYDKAITYSNAILSANIINPKLERLVYSNLALLYKNLNQNRLSLQYAQKSIRFSISNNLPLLGDDFVFSAIAFEKLGKIDSANVFYQKALMIFESEYGQKHYVTAIGYLNYSMFLLEIGNLSEGEKYANMAFKILVLGHEAQGRTHAAVSGYYRLKGSIQLEKGDFYSSIDYFQKALENRIGDFVSTFIFDNPDSVAFIDIELIDILELKAKALEEYSISENSTEHLILSLETIKLAAKFLDDLRTRFGSTHSKLFLVKNENQIHQTGIRISYKLYKITQKEKYKYIAFEFAERSKYALLRELQDENYAKVHGNISDSLLQVEETLNRNLAGKRALLIAENQKEEPDTMIINRLYSQLFLLSRKKEQLISKMERLYPEYYRLKYHTKIINPDSIMKSLNSDQALIEYAFTDSLLFTFVALRDSFAMFAQTVDSYFFSQVDTLINSLTSLHSKSYREFRKPSYFLYSKLIIPVEHLIQGKRLIIVPDGQLGLLSFEVLTTSPYKKNPYHLYKDEPYLLYKYPITYSFSATLGNDQIEKKQTRLKKPFLGFAPKYSLSDLPDIPESRESVKFISRLIGGKALTNQRATKSNFLKFYNDYNILHLYVHGFEDTLNPELSSMAFYYEKSNGEEAFLEAYQISNLNIASEMVVLASCYSGSGEYVPGEGVMSIARGFYNAGSKCVVTSLWRSTANPTIDILRTYYLNLFIGRSKSEALNRAKIKYLKNANTMSAHPRHWASLIIIGNDMPIASYLIPRYLTILSIIFILFLALVWRKRINRFFSKSS